MTELIAVGACFWMVGIAWLVLNTRDTQRAHLKWERDKLAAKVNPNQEYPVRAHLESPAYREWAEPREALAEFDKRFPGVRGRG